MTDKSLLANSSFQTRNEKDLQIGLEIIQALASPAKGHQRAVSAKWMNGFREYIDQLRSTGKQIQIQRPGPINNFDLVSYSSDLMPEYAKLVQSLGTSDWQSHFKDWSLMSLREDVFRDQDFVLINTSSWLKLVTAFGGAPEIPIYQYFIENVRTLEDGSQVFEKTSAHDLNPIKVHLTAIETKTKSINHRQSVLASPFLTNKYFLSQVVLPISEMSLVRAMFVVRPYRQEGDNLPVIYRVPDSQIKLFECGIQENAQVLVITDLQTTPINTKNCVHMIAKLFDIPREELSSMVFESEIEIKQDLQKQSQPKLTSNNLSKLDAQNKDKFFDDLEFEPPGIQVGRSEVPEEYANDPDLWYAIQASMNEGPSQRETQQDDFNFEAKRNELDLPEQEKVQTESTGENIASLNDAFETPKKKADQGIKTFDFLGQLSSAENQQAPTINKQDYMRLIREKRQNSFEEKRLIAQKIVQNRETATLLMFGQSDCEKSMRGQLGQPFKLYGELSTSLQKLEAVTEMIANGEEVKDAMRFPKRGSMTGLGEDADME